MQLRATRLTCIAHAARRAVAPAFTPTLLFASGEQGAWYDPSDMSTLFQDSAGTTPVTAVEQPVGRMLDKSGRGNHATQATAINRPVLSARVNLLTKTERFDDAAVWATASNVTIAANTTETLDPLGTNTADKIIEAATTASHRVLATGIAQAANTSYALTFRAKKGTRNWCRLFFGSSALANATSVEQYFNLDTLAKGTQVTAQTAGSTAMAVFTSASIEDIGSGWRLLKIIVTTQNSPTELQVAFGLANADAVFSYAGNTSEYAYIWGADLRVANDGVGLPPYQYVNTPTDYDSSPDWPRYLRFDGIDDGMVTGTITPGTDKVQVFAGVRKLSDVGFAPFLELSAAIFNGSFNLSAPGGANSATFGFASRGSTATAGIANSPTTFSAPITAVLCGIGSISEDISNLQINGIASGSGAADQGTGNYLSYPLYIGRRGGTSNPFNGCLYPLIVRFGPTLTAEQIAQTETWVNSKTRAYA